MVKPPVVRLGPDSPLHAKIRAPSRDLEHQEHSLFIQWCGLRAINSPLYRLIFAIPNFSGRLGKATIPQSQRLNREGRKKGVPDLCFPVARRGYFALYIEMKAPGEKARPEQLWWHVELQLQGYLVAVCDSALVAEGLMEWYVAGDKTYGANGPEECPFLP